MMISARGGRAEITDILLCGHDIDTDIQENVGYCLGQCIC